MSSLRAKSVFFFLSVFNLDCWCVYEPENHCFFCVCVFKANNLCDFIWVWLWHGKRCWPFAFGKDKREEGGVEREEKVCAGLPAGTWPPLWEPKTPRGQFPPLGFLMAVHRGNNHKKPGSLSEWVLTSVSYSNHSSSAGQFPLNMQNCEDKMWDLPFSMHIKDTCHQDVTQELWEQEVQFLRDRLTHHQNHEIRPGKISLWWEKCYTLVHFAYKKKEKRKNWNGCM